MSLRAYARERNVTVWQARKACPPSAYNARRREIDEMAALLGQPTVGHALAELARAGFSLQQVADKFGLTKSCIRYQAEKWGVRFGDRHEVA